MLNCGASLPPAPNPHAMRFSVSLLLAVLLLSACGYKGPLYLPKPEAQRPAPAQDPAKDPAPSK